MSNALQAFENRTELRQFTHNGLLLFALELRFGIDDICTVAATALTDGSKDRKCDLLYIDQDSRTAVLAQGYVATNVGKAEAPANKAANLATAAAWVLGNERPDDLGSSLRTASEELHAAIESGEIDALELWYSHNLPESQNVNLELERAAKSANALLLQLYPELAIDVRSLEVGRSTLDDWYLSTQSPILVTDKVDIPATNWFRESGDGWSAVSTSVPAKWLHDLYSQYGDRLFSANVRGYMPSRRTAQNINFGIEQTARTQPGRFWAFNNGVTALVHGISTDAEPSLSMSGIAIVNGAQTTGALARVDPSLLADARVLIRFVLATNSSLVEEIIRYNNSQNQIKPSDFRSGDRPQERLRSEFQKIPDATYLGARRGGAEDRARRPSNLISSDTAAQAIAAFHQDPAIAYHELRSIWEKDEIYARYFSDQTKATHIVFCYSLWRRVVETKAELTAVEGERRTAEQDEALDFLRKRGSLHLLVAAIAGSAEVYLDRKIMDSFDLSFGDSVSPSAAAEYWMPLVDALLPFAPGNLGSVFDSGGLRRKEEVMHAIKSFRAVVSSTKRANSEIFNEFRARVMGS